MSFEEIKEEAKSAETLEELFSLWKQAHAADLIYHVISLHTRRSIIR